MFRLLKTPWNKSPKSPGSTQFMPYLSKKMSKSPLNDPFLGYFGSFLSFGAPRLHSEQQLFIAWNHIVCHRLDKKRATTLFLTPLNHFEKRTSIAQSSLQHLQVRHSVICRIALILRPNALLPPPLVNNWLISFSRAAITLLRFLTTQLNVNVDTALYISGKKQWKW